MIGWLAQKFPKRIIKMREPSDQVAKPLKDRVGLNAVEKIILEEFRWFFREQPISDHGIDAHIEELDGKDRPTGKLIALQIKSGTSYFRKRGEDYVFHGELRHLDYWTNHSLPCFIILHNPESGLMLWQKVERRLATVSGKRWSIVIPSRNVLDKTAKQYFEREVAADPESIRRFNMAFDLKIMRQINVKDTTYFEINWWVNKQLNMRDVGVMFDEPGKDEPDLKIPLWAPAQNMLEFMTRYFPWLDYEYNEISDPTGGEVQVHSIRVWLNDLGKSYLAVEDYFSNGLPEREEPEVPEISSDAFSDEEAEEYGYQRAMDRDPFD